MLVLGVGERLALVIAGTDADYNGGDTPTGTRVTVDLSRSSVTVPVMLQGRDPSTLTEPRARTAWRGPARVSLPVQPRKFH